ncbi:hypothetical protein KIF53_15505 [Chromobacterium subtsugae]|mgnify:CR=1 FL=1|uniref:Uncharacterized protein n=1 Tax=Chromobacterium subtsugae TaxID=251747 RepID=A0ABS7FG32_9NEIS|nr:MULTISPECIES: hypothetical protein [Chromobacterium]KUM02752.1 hypothetical protein Cv017_01485 [Chromobacterium subtsugae]KZE84969.1 hypothetical protein AWB61_03035 [Chromobacterium sp. F49]MBW7567812.1 hypothetical protein [Chromobacterium subtsugae]MBW8289039.1 hypothetical protein [Chromobacterium subtsugae]WSE93817.1 hypothetical protein U6115_11395 [Chromobacterium subtsugae]
MTRYSKRQGGGVTAHYNSAADLVRAEDEARESNIRSFGLLVGLIGGGLLTWHTIMAHGGAEWPKAIRLILTVLGAAAGGAALYWLSVLILAMFVGAVVVSIAWLFLRWLWSVI